MTTTDPISPTDLTRCDTVLRHLHESLRRTWRALPGAGRTAAGAARLLDLERTTCQRIGFVANRPFDLASILDRLPGRNGLTAFAAACERNEVGNAESRLQLREALDAAELVWTELAGSAHALAQRLRGVVDETLASQTTATGATAQPSDAAPVRRQHHELSVQIVGRRVQHAYLAVILAPSDTNEFVRKLTLHAQLGVTGRAGAIPMTMGSTRNIFGEGLVPSTGSMRDPVIVPRFSTSPLPITRVGEDGPFVMQHVRGSNDDAVDVTRFFRADLEHPGLGGGDETSTLLVHNPIARLTLDLLVHERVVRGAVPFADVILDRPDSAALTLDEAWLQRLDTVPAIRRLDAGEVESEPIDAMRAWLLEQAGGTAASFAGYRVDEAFPIWRTGYRIGVRGVRAP